MAPKLDNHFAFRCPVVHNIQPSAGNILATTLIMFSLNFFEIISNNFRSPGAIFVKWENRRREVVRHLEN